MVAWNKLRVKVAGTWPGAPGSYRVHFTINGVAVQKTQSAAYPTFEFKLDELGVPRFSGPQRFNVYVDPVLNGVIGTPSPPYSVFIPLPVIIVQGIITDLFPPTRPESLISLLTANGYRTDGPTNDDYPTVVLLDTSYGYRPSTELLEANADQLTAAVAAFTSSLKTYASRVDIVSHSKGGLVSRMYLKRHDPTGATVRRLVMACSPHTGSAEATTYVNLILNTAVLKELAPVDPWKRAYTLLPFLVPPEWANPTLTALDQTAIPPATQTYLFYGNTYPTKANYTGGLGAAWGQIDGDGWVTKLSQRGYTISNLQSGAVTAGPRIAAFPTPPIEVGLPYGHSGYLNNARDQVLWALTR